MRNQNYEGRRLLSHSLIISDEASPESVLCLVDDLIKNLGFSIVTRPGPSRNAPSVEFAIAERQEREQRQTHQGRQQGQLQGQQWGGGDGRYASDEPIEERLYRELASEGNMTSGQMVAAIDRLRNRVSTLTPNA